MVVGCSEPSRGLAERHHLLCTRRVSPPRSLRPAKCADPFPADNGSPRAAMPFQSLPAAEPSYLHTLPGRQGCRQVVRKNGDWSCTNHACPAFIPATHLAVLEQMGGMILLNCICHRFDVQTCVAFLRSLCFVGGRSVVSARCSSA